MSRQTKIEIKPLRADLVQWFRSLPHLEGDRDQQSTIGKQRIAWFAKLCRDGEFYSPDWAIAICDGRQYRVNGGHSSLMLAAAGEHFPLGLPVVLRWFSCQSYADVLELFNHFDNRKSLRSTSDKTKVHKSIHADLTMVAPTYINRMLNGIQCFYNNGNSLRGDEDDRTRLIHGETAFLAWAAKYVRPRFMGRSGVIACMYRSYNADAKLAEQFWSMVHDESAPQPAHPTRVLAKFLQELDMPVCRNKWDSRAIYVKCLHAWNAWQSNDQTNLKYFPESDIPPLLINVSGRLRAF